MCTMIAQQAKITGSGKSAAGSGKNAGTWFKVDTLSVSYDHPFDLPLEYSLNLDFTSLGERVAVELDLASARRLVETIQAVLQQAEMGGFLEK